MYTESEIKKEMLNGVVFYEKNTGKKAYYDSRFGFIINQDKAPPVSIDDFSNLVLTKDSINFGSRLASDLKFYTDYSKYDEELDKYENWSDSVNRIMGMHKSKYSEKMTPELSGLFDFVSSAYKDKLILGSQRALQFGGDPILNHNSKMYNCLSSYADRPEFFQEAMYWLLSGCGIGFSVQECHIKSLPEIQPVDSSKVKVFKPDDSIEGWADCFGVLISSYFSNNPTFPDYQGCRVDFDLSGIRPRGSKISGGFKAPGSDGLRKSLIKAQQLLERATKKGKTKFKSIDIYDFVMHMSDAVLSGGVRRSATICIFDVFDEDMLKAKTGNWYSENPQRARSNNSAALILGKVTKEQYLNAYEKIRYFGEPAFLFLRHEDFVFNPCVEVGMYCRADNGKTGWQGCNLAEGNGAKCDTEEKFYKACKALAIISTLQAGYTDFKYVSKESKEIFERESLIGVSFTGWANNPDVMFNEEVQRRGAEIVKKWNKIVAEIVGINPAARTTLTKPSGNASVVLECASGIHGEHAPMYFRNMQMNKDNDVAKLFKKVNPLASQESVWSENGTDWIFSIPIVAKKGSLFKKDLLGVKQLDLVKLTQNNWVEYGTNYDLCVKDGLKHNVSNTIQVDDWDEVCEYLWENRDHFVGVSLLSLSGDRDYKQAPFVEVFSSEQLHDMYGDASLLASGLIVDGLTAFNNDLWDAVEAFTANTEYEDSHEFLLKKDWVRRAKNFSINYLGGDNVKTGYCLKDVYNFHRWLKINRSFKDIDFSKADLKPVYTEIDTTGAIACAGGACEVSF